MKELAIREAKINKVIHLVENNPKVDFDPETTTFFIVPCNCKFITDFDKDLNEIMYNVNSYILEKNYRKDYNIEFLGNFGSFIMEKLRELTKDNKKLQVLPNGEIDIMGHLVTIKLDLFQPFKTIISHINDTIVDVERNQKAKIGQIQYNVNSTSVKMKTNNGKRTKRSTK